MKAEGRGRRTIGEAVNVRRSHSAMDYVSSITQQTHSHRATVTESTHTGERQSTLFAHPRTLSLFLLFVFSLLSSSSILSHMLHATSSARLSFPLFSSLSSSSLLLFPRKRTVLPPQLRAPPRIKDRVATPPALGHVQHRHPRPGAEHIPV